MNSFEGVFQDVRYALRSFRRNLGFTTVAVITLALGVGANSTMFTLVNGLFFEPPSGIASPEQLVRVNATTQSSQSRSFSYPDFVFFRDNNRAFSGVTAYSRGFTPLTANVETNLLPVDALLVAGN